MNGREAVKALMDGKRVRRQTHVAGYFIDFDAIVGGGCQWTLAGLACDDHVDWSIAESPMTDEQLIAEWERLATNELVHSVNGMVPTDYGYTRALQTCARQLRERKL